MKEIFASPRKKSGSPIWCAQMDLNHRPLDYKSSALTAELWARKPTLI